MSQCWGVRFVTRTFSEVARWWRAVSAWGDRSGSVGHKRAVRGGNHFFTIASISGIPWVVALFVSPYESTTLPAITHSAMILAWVLCLAMNRIGFSTTASVLSLLAPLAQFTYLTHIFGREAAFHLNLLAIGAFAFVIFLPTQWPWRVLFTLAGFAAGASLYANSALGEPAVDVSETWIRNVAIGNVAQVSLMVYLLAALNSYYFNRERRRNQMLLTEAQVAAQTDSLTELLNRRGIAPAFSKMVRQGEFAIALADLDRFKRINDRLGHGAGDVVLSSVARTLLDAIGPRGKVARWGGEEFLILMPGADLAKATALMERARKAVEDEFTDDGVIDTVTMSVGIAHAPRGAGREEALRLADALLYEAKASGRNIVLSGEVTPGAIVERRKSRRDRRSV